MGNPRYSEDQYPLQDLTDAIIAAAVEVHRNLGPGYVERIYENALVLELEARGHAIQKQLTVEVVYRA
jgi:GxxExxY protein